MVVSKKNNDADPPSAKKAKLAPAEADPTKVSADEAAAAAAARAGGLSKETLLKVKVEESAVGKKVAAATAADIEALLAAGAKTAARFALHLHSLPILRLLSINLASSTLRH